MCPAIIGGGKQNSKAGAEEPGNRATSCAKILAPADSAQEYPEKKARGRLTAELAAPKQYKP